MIQNLLVVPLFIISGEHQLTMIEEALIKKVSIAIGKKLDTMTLKDLLNLLIIIKSTIIQ